MAGKSIPIFRYAREGNLAEISAELAKGTPVDIRDLQTGRTPLMEAVAGAHANAKFVKLLIAHGADVNASAEEPKMKGVNLDDIAALLNNTDATAQIPGLEAVKTAIANLNARKPSSETALSLALSAGNPEVIQTLLDAGADVHYLRPHNYDALIDVMHGRRIAHDPHLVPLVQLLINRGAKLNTVTDYSESALSVASNNGRFDAIRVLLDAGADAGPLEWTPLMHAIAFGTLNDVETQLKAGADLTARDFWSRTPWLLSLQVGDVAKAQMLLAAGASRTDRGRCGKTPLICPIINRHTPMLRWLLDEGFDPNDTDDFQGTALMEAAESGATECVKILLEAGADFHRPNKYSGKAIKIAANLDIVRLLVDHGADINELSDEMRAKLTHVSSDGELFASEDEYRAAKHRRFGTTNPEKMSSPFWRAMVKCGVCAYAARASFNDVDSRGGAVWCFKRFGKSMTLLPDGRIVEIGGEHEDFYDPDFCIYNDVVVHHGDGTFDIYGYPKETFPPTDFHSATLVGNHIYIIGRLGYQGQRQFDQTPVYRLNLKSFEIQALPTSGDKPGWIHRHTAIMSGDDQIRISGGTTSLMEDGKEQLKDNPCVFLLDLSTSVWKKIT